MPLQRTLTVHTPQATQSIQLPLDGSMTAGQLKRLFGRPDTDEVYMVTHVWVVKKLSESDLIPEAAQFVSIVPIREKAKRLSSQEWQRLLGRLETEAAYLQYNVGYREVIVQSTGQDGVVVYVPEFPVPPGWNKQTTEVGVEIPTYPPGYPTVPPTWFYIHVGLLSASYNHRTDKLEERLPHDLFLSPGSRFTQAASIPQAFSEKFNKLGFQMQSWKPVWASHQHFTRGDSLVSFCEALYERLKLPENTPGSLK